VSFFHAGLLPMNEADDSSTDSVQLDKSSAIIDHGKSDGLFGLLSIKGVKYTTAPDIAEKVVSLMATNPVFSGRKDKSSYQPKPSALMDFGAAINLLGGQFGIIRNHLEKRYGTSWRDVFCLLAAELTESSEVVQEDALWLVERPRLLRAEVLHFIKNEMAVQLADVVFRRSETGSAECPPESVLLKIAACMGAELGWSDEEQARQIAMVQSVFMPIAALAADHAATITEE